MVGPDWRGLRWATASGSTGSTFSPPVLDSDSFSESESLPYETREAMAADILDVVNTPEAEGRYFRCYKNKGQSSSLVFQLWTLLNMIMNDKKKKYMEILRVTKIEFYSKDSWFVLRISHNVRNNTRVETEIYWNLLIELQKMRWLTLFW